MQKTIPAAPVPVAEAAAGGPSEDPGELSKEVAKIQGNEQTACTAGIQRPLPELGAVESFRSPLSASV
jgi:hypothetical protein